MSTRLNLHTRPTVEFDVNNPQHRSIFRTFLVQGTWAHSPFQFAVQGAESVAASTARQLLQYYINKDFELS